MLFCTQLANAVAGAKFLAHASRPTAEFIPILTPSSVRSHPFFPYPFNLSFTKPFSPHMLPLISVHWVLEIQNLAQRTACTIFEVNAASRCSRCSAHEVK